MAQPVFYTYSGAFIPGTLARAEAEATEFTSVQVGFDKLAIQGIDSGKTPDGAEKLVLEPMLLQ